MAFFDGKMAGFQIPGLSNLQQSAGQGLQSAGRGFLDANVNLGNTAIFGSAQNIQTGLIGQAGGQMEDSAEATAAGGITTQSDQMDYLASGFGATYNSDTGRYENEDGSIFEANWEMLDEYQTSGDVKKSMSQLDKLSGKQASLGGKYMGRADEMLAGGSDYARKLAQEQQMGIQSGAQQQMRQAEQTAAMTGVDAGQSSLLKSVMATGTGEQMRKASVSAEQQAQSMGMQQAQLGQGLLGQATSSRTQLLAAQQAEQGAKEQRYEDIVELKNDMSGQVRDEEVLQETERKANLSAYNALEKSDKRLSQYTDDAGGQLYGSDGKNQYSGKTFQEEFLEGKITTAPGVTKTYDEVKIGNMGGGGVMGDVEALRQSTLGRWGMGLATMGMSEVARYGADKGLLGETGKQAFGGGGQRYG